MSRESLQNIATGVVTVPVIGVVGSDPAYNMNV
jgi:hypothetical protein